MYGKSKNPSAEEIRKLIKVREFVQMLVSIRMQAAISKSSYNTPKGVIPIIERRIHAKLDTELFFAGPTGSLLNVDATTAGSPLTQTQHLKVLRVVDEITNNYILDLQQAEANKKKKMSKDKEKVTSGVRIYGF